MPGETDLTNCDKQGSEVSLYYDTADDPTTAGGSTCTTPVWVYHKGITGDLSINETADEEELSVYRDWETDRKSTRLNSSHLKLSRMPSSA